MDKDILRQYADLLAERDDLRKRIRKAEDELIKLCSEQVADVVTHGKKGKKPLGRTVVQGAPHDEIAKKRKALQRYKRQLVDAEATIDDMITEAQKYIETINDSRIRRIFRYRYADKLTWVQVAFRMGGQHTAESCRKTAERFLQEEGK